METNVRSYSANGKAIRDLRAAKGLSVEELARLSKLSVGTIQNLEKSERAFLVSIRKCAEALNVKPERLLASAPEQPSELWEELQPQPSIQVVITFPLTFKNLDQAEALIVRVERLAEKLRLYGPVDVTGLEPGSVIITLQVPLAQMIGSICHLFFPEDYLEGIRKLHISNLQLQEGREFSSLALFVANTDLAWGFKAIRKK